MAQSLWREGDLDLRDNLAREDWREYTPGPVAPHYGAPRADGRPFPAHSPGLPFAPRARLRGGRPAACAWSLLALAGAGADRRGLAAGRAGRPEGRAGARSPGLAAAGPAGPLLRLPRLHRGAVGAGAGGALRPAARAAVGGGGRRGRAPRLGAALAARQDDRRPRPRWAWSRVVPPARARRWPRSSPWPRSWRRGLSGVLPRDLRHRLPARHLRRPAGRAAGRRRCVPLVGLLLDRSFGLLWHAPVFLVALAGLPEAWRRRMWPHALLVVAVLVPALWLADVVGRAVPARRASWSRCVPLLAVCAGLRTDPASPVRGLARWRFVARRRSDRAVAVFTAARPGEPAAPQPRRPADARVGGALRRRRCRPLSAVAGARRGRTRTASRSSGWSALAVLMVLDALARRVPRVDRLVHRRGPADPAAAGRGHGRRPLGPPRGERFRDIVV